ALPSFPPRLSSDLRPNPTRPFESLPFRPSSKRVLSRPPYLSRTDCVPAQMKPISHPEKFSRRQLPSCPTAKLSLAHFSSRTSSTSLAPQTKLRPRSPPNGILPAPSAPVRSPASVSICPPAALLPASPNSAAASSLHSP